MSSPSLSAQSRRDQVDTKFPPRKCPSSRRTLSFSSFSSNSSAFSYFIEDESPLSPVSPLGLSGVPFSWEKQPGIPKKQNSMRKKDSASTLLPLPPHQGTSQGCKKFNNAEAEFRKKFNSSKTFVKDPFLAALLECSKDDVHDTSSKFWTGPKVTRGVNDRIGFVSLYTSCKRTCAITESIISIPKSMRGV